MNRFMVGCGLAAVGLYFSVACTSTTTGNEGNLDFSYSADDQVTNFNKPVAVGAKLELKVWETGTRQPVELDEATTDNEEVLAVETFTSNRIILVGQGEGSALVEVSATLPDGAMVSDSVNMLSAVPDTLELRHPCTLAGGTQTYLVNTDNVHIGFDMKKSNGQAVIGYGYFPIDISPANGAELDEMSTDQANFHLDLGDTPQMVTVTSTLDENELLLDIRAEAEIDGLEQGTAITREVRVDETILLSIYPKVGESRVCASNAEMTAENLTPSICEVKANVPPEETEDTEGLSQRTGIVSVKGKEFGICKFTATFPNAAGGEGVNADFEVEVGDFPDAGDE